MSTVTLDRSQVELSTVSFLYDALGKRKYLTAAERTAFLMVANGLAPEGAATFCATMAHTGARISEALELAPTRIDLVNSVIVIRSLKKRRQGVYRAIPVPPELLRDLERVHSLQKTQADEELSQNPLWPFGRTTAWHLIKRAMALAGIDGPQATAKGLRHGFAVSALQCGVPLNVVSKWLGHAHLRTTAIYADVVGEEERRLAELMWRNLDAQ